MKRLFLLSALAFIVSCNTAVRQDTLKVLFVGNASVEENFGDYLQKMAASEGRSLVMDNFCPEAGYAGLEQALLEELWDVVAMEQSDDIGEIFAAVKANTAAGCRLMLLQGWAYANEAAYPGFEKYNFSQEEMYGALCKQSREYAKKYHLDIIPSGTAVQNSRKSFNGENVTSDGFHMTKLFGRYLLACTFYEAVCGTAAEIISYAPEHLDKDRTELARCCAHMACSNPYTALSTNVKPNYGEWYMASLKKMDKIRQYKLPDALTMNDGSKVETPEQWYGKRRAEILEMFETEMFGKAPGKIEGTTFTVVDEDRNALEGKAIRKQIKIDFHKNDQYIMVLMYLPNDAKGKVPVFAGLNFEGNATVNADPAILYPAEGHARAYGVYSPKERGSHASRWPVEEIIARGYGLVTFHASDVDPDFDDGFVNGVHGIFNPDGQPRKGDEWGTISAWAWGLSRVMDYLETDPDIDATRVSAIGHSRLGKTALLAGARDQRFAMVVSNCSGCCGAALSRRNYGETVEAIIHQFPHWFCGNFFKYADDPDSMPFDQHELLALIAPRPLYVGSAEDDAWADPVGERIALQEAQNVYHFLGLEPGLTGHHIHEGEHSLTLYDWTRYMDFADFNLKR